MIEVCAAAPDDPAAVRLLDALSETLETITGSSGRVSFDPADMAGESALFALAILDGEAAGCGAFRPLQPGVAEIKRMYAAPGTQGVGAALLAFLESEAARMGYREAWLETRAVNTRAVRFYERHGYARIENFGKYRGRSEAVCFAKPLSSALV